MPFLRPRPPAYLGLVSGRNITWTHAVALIVASLAAFMLLMGLDVAQARGFRAESPSPSPTPSESPSASPSPSALPSLEGGQWNINGATVKLAGGLAGQVEAAGNTFKVTTQATKGAWAAGIAVEGGGPATFNGTITAPGPTIDATLQAAGRSVNVHGTPGQNLTVSFGRPAPKTRAASDVKLLAALNARPLAGESAADTAATLGGDWLGGFIAFTIVGWLLILIAPGLKRRAELANHSMPFGRLGLGVVLLLDIPLASIVIFAIGLPLGLWWLGLVGLFALALLSVAGYAFAGLQAGRLILDAVGAPQLTSFAAVPIGVAVIVLAGLLPYIGTLVSILITAYGLGSMVYAPRQPVAQAVAEEGMAVRAEDAAAKGGRPVVE